MKNRWMGSLSLVLAACAALSVPAFAAEPVTMDDFSDPSTLKNWEVDGYQPDDFYVDRGVLYLAMGPDGYIRNRAEEYRDKAYNMQGYKLEVDSVSATGWTASAKLLLDDTWYGVRTDSYLKERAPKVEYQTTLDNKKKVLFQVDLIGSNKQPPAITVIKGGDDAPIVKYYDPQADQEWGTAQIDWAAIQAAAQADAETAQQGLWVTLTITFQDGKVTYYLDDQEIGSCTRDSQKAQPDYLKLSMQNFQRPDVSAWDDVCLYDGVQKPGK